MYLAWRYGGENPYRLYHIGTPAAELPPPFPGRVRAFLYACALQAREDHVEEIKAQAGVR